jgi:hypothetical protein
MDTIEDLYPQLAPAFTGLVSLGASMVMSFRAEDAKSCTRLCRALRTFAATPAPSDLAGVARALSTADDLTAATALLRLRLGPLTGADAPHLKAATAAIASLRDTLAAGEVAVLESAAA